MSTFEDIQQSWLSQPVNQMVDPGAIQFVQSKWQKHQRKVFFNNLMISIGFLAAMIVIAWVFIAFRHQYGWLFDASIAVVYCLLIVYLFITWKGYGFKKENLEVSGADYINYQIVRLQWQRKILTRYVWIYMVLLWIALSFYVAEVTKRGTVLFTLTALAIITLYFTGIALWTRFRKNKKQLSEIDALINELKQLHNALDQQ